MVPVRYATDLGSAFLKAIRRLEAGKGSCIGKTLLSLGRCCLRSQEGQQAKRTDQATCARARSFEV